MNDDVYSNQRSEGKMVFAREFFNIDTKTKYMI